MDLDGHCRKDDPVADNDDKAYNLRTQYYLHIMQRQMNFKKTFLHFLGN